MCQLPEEIVYSLIKNRATEEEDWTNLFFDLDWLEQFGFAHWSDFAIMEEQSGLLCLSKSSIEIKKGRKLLEKFSADQLTQSTSLFDLYRTRSQTLTLSPTLAHIRFVLFQTEIGLAGKFKLDEEFLRMDDLEFVLTDLAFPNAPRLLTSILYQGQTLNKTSDDTVVSGFRVVFIDHDWEL